MGVLAPRPLLTARRAGGLLLLVLALVAGAPVVGMPVRAQPIDTLLVNGRILTQDVRAPIVDALAIRDDRIVATGDDAVLRARASPATRVVDLGGRTVIPGLIDSHIHAIRAGVRFAGEVSWIGARSIPEAMARISRAAEGAEPAAWIVVAGGWTPGQFAEGRRPTEAELVAAARDRPAYVQSFYRAVLLTPAARAALGMAGEADLPAGLRVERGDDGAPTGWLGGDSAAITALYERLPRPTLADSIEGTRRFLHELNRHGVTGVIDPGGHNLAPEDYAALFALWRADGLTARIAYSICAPRPGHELDDLQALTQFLPMGFGDAMLRFNGIGERVTWALYNNDTPTAAQKDAFHRVARWAADSGLALTVHWNNDASAHHLLEVLERVDRAVPIRPLRWSVAHLHDASEPTLARLQALGVGWLMQNGLYFAAPGFLAARAAAIDRSPAIKTGLRLGVPIGGGTDANRVMDYNPFVALQWMVDGRTVDGLPTRGAAERLTREEALRVYTAGSAWFSFDEDRRGTLAPGRLADLAVLDRDYLTVPTAEIGRLRALLTLVGGRVVHADPPFDALAPGWAK